MKPASVPVLNIIGPVGIGKSTVAEAVSDILQQQNVPHAIADLDNIRRSYPYPDNDPFNMAMGFKNLAAVWRNYSNAGAKRLIIPSVMEGPEDFDKIRNAVPGAELFVVRLDAPLEVIHARIEDRERTPESLEWHRNRSTQLSQELREKKLEHIVVESSSRTPGEIAKEIVAKWNFQS